MDFDELADSVAAAVPGFGGFYVDADHNLVIWAKDPSRGAQLRSAISRFYSAPELATLPIQVRKADFDVRDLRRWRGQMERALAGLDWRFDDIDERINRLTVGVPNAGVALAVQNALRATAIPTAAIVITTAPPIRLAQTPDNTRNDGGVRPIPAGVNISPFQYGYGCTLTTLAKADTASSTFFGITASHCTPTLDHNDNTSWYQYGGLPVLFEYYEAPFTPTLTHGIGPNPCTPGYTCRYADAVLMQTSVYTNLAYGQIARTVDSTYTYSGGRASNNLDLSVSPYRSYSIGTETTMGSFYAGLVVHKMGRNTGHSYGPVTSTCVNTHPLMSLGAFGTFGGGDSTLVDKYYVCQMYADMYVETGDSGSPVFLTSTSGITTLAGLLWAIAPGGTGIIFSPIDGVHFDLGPFATYPRGSIY